MAKRIQLRETTEEEQRVLRRLSTSHKAEAALVRRARIVLGYYAGQTLQQIGSAVQMDEDSVSRWVHRFVENGLEGLRDKPRSGRPPIYSVDEVSLVIHTALTRPEDLGLPFGSWTLDRLQAYLQEEKGMRMKRSRIDEILLKEGLRWREPRMVVWGASRS